MDTTQELPPAVIFDFDGTFCDIRSILHHIDRNDDHLAVFHESTCYAPENSNVFDLLKDVQESNIQPILLSMRGERWRNVTTEWLVQRGFTPEIFHMRKDDDNRSGPEVKRELLYQLQQEWNILAAIDDDPKVVNMWRSESIPTIMVPGYNDQGDPRDMVVPSWWEETVCKTSRSA